MIRVVIVDDVATVRELLKIVLEKDPEIRIVGMANGGKQAIDIIPVLKPDIVLMDLRMPDMDGFQTVRHIMGYFPVPILIISSTSTNMFQVFECGALDFIEKPSLSILENDFIQASILINKVKALSKAKVSSSLNAKFEKERILTYTKSNIDRKKAVAIASSTGGPGALRKIIPLLPKDFPVGIIIVQHISQGFIGGLVDWLQKLSRIKIRVARENDIITPGEVLFSPDTCHIILDEKGRIKFENSPPVGGVRPSADILFPSVAKYYGSSLVGVIMTGMGDDGARGMEVIKKSGGGTIAQDEDSCVVFGMPKAAIDRKIIDKVVPLHMIPETIIKLLKLV
ncbi:MAG: chemotaxis-specific protein-glutamate methyltransferase CheB [bacterium]|nr:chemotaxis-specific protein-glutamate methyltransferase CheB [bacterium]